jgi:membrane-bound lytic murein transglycosylase B
MSHPVSQSSDFAAFIDALRQQALAAGISPGSIDAGLAGITLVPEPLRQDAAQPEHALAAGEYVGRLVTVARIERGRRILGEHAGILDAITAAYGVPAEIVLAIWGIESNYGDAMGDAGVIQSLATLAFKASRRRAFWCEQLIAALRIIDTEPVQPRQLVGSWAGAMGHTQFMPTTYLDHAVDFDGDGVRDIWRGWVDALASAANYLRHSGWQSDLAWGYQVELAPGFDFAIADPTIARAWGEWRDAGVRLGQHAPTGLPAACPCRLVLVAGWRGPAFVVTCNFDAILAYNQSNAYALSVGVLADEVAQRAARPESWPLERALLRDERIELQRRLNAAGFDTNGIDGILGRGSVLAVRAYQLRHGLRADGHGNRALLAFMRENGDTTC